MKVPRLGEWATSALAAGLAAWVAVQWRRDGTAPMAGESPLQLACAPSTLRIIPMAGKTFGADVYGFEPAEALESEAIISTILTALERHLVLVFHGVSDKMTPEMHLQFSKMFGPVDPEISSPPSYLTKGKFNSPDAAQRALQRGGRLEDLGATMLQAAATSRIPRAITRIVKEPSDLIAFGEGWHSDLTYRQATPFAAILVSRDLPSKGGNTQFSDMRVAWERLPADLRAAVRELRGNHTDGHDLFSLHPVVRHDNKYGRESLFDNKAFTRALVPPNSEEAPADPALLQALLDFVETLPSRSPEAWLDVAWKPGQMLMWDNRFTQHAAMADYTERREMHRTIVSGTVPF